MSALNLDHQRKQARALLKAVRALDPHALTRVRTYACERATHEMSLSVAQLVVARENGFGSWARLKQQVRVECLARPMMRCALWAAANRARETDLPHPLYRDPYACALAGDEGRALFDKLSRANWPGYGSGPNPYLSVMTKFFDDALLSVVNDRLIRQVVILNAGMDTRAFRLAWPSGLEIFEVDTADAFDHKERLLTQLGARAACRRHVLAAALNGQWVRMLLKRGFDPNRPAAFFIDRIEYVDAAAARRLLHHITVLAGEGSWIGFAAHTDATRRSPFLTALLQTRETLGLPPWQFGLDEPEAWLATCGWTASSVIAGAPQAHFGRWPMRHVPRDTPSIPRAFFTQGWKNRREAL